MKRCRGRRDNGKTKCGASFAALVLACAAVLSVGTVTLSRYVLKWTDKQVAAPANFYFESDYLKEGGADYTVYTGSVTFYVANNDGLNVTSDTIAYTIEGVDDVNSGGSLPGNAESKAEYTLTGLPGDKKIVTAAASSPYVKTLSATFAFADPGESTVYEVTDHGHYITLDLYTGAATGDITVNYGSDLTPDSTNARMSGWLSGGSGTLSGLSPNACYSLVFFETTVGEHSSSGQQVLNGGTITIS